MSDQRSPEGEAREMRHHFGTFQLVELSVEHSRRRPQIPADVKGEELALQSPVQTLIHRILSNKI